jgi:large subunit ribosomal protein L7Ae
MVKEYSKEEINKAYEAIELARKSGKIKKGTNEVTKAVEKNTAKLVLVAKDTSPKEVVMHMGPLCDEKKIPCIEVPSKEDLGSAAGLMVSTSAVAIVVEGESKDIIKGFLND